MGCQSSQLSKSLRICIKIIDPSFTKIQNQKIRNLMDDLEVQYETYVSISCFIQDMLKIYTNQVITTQQLLQQVVSELSQVSFKPNIFCLSSKLEKPKIVESKFLVHYFNSYQQIIDCLLQKKEKKRQYNQNPHHQRTKKSIILKIFKKSSKESSAEQMIFQSTLKSRKITYQIYHSFSELENSMESTKSSFILTDQIYHKEVIQLVENTLTRVICFCEFQRQKLYDPDVYFVTNNFLQIVSEVCSEQQVSHLNLVKCLKVFIYQTQTEYLSEYTEIISYFNFQVEIYSDLNEIMKKGKYFFAVTIIINPEQRKEVEKILQSNHYLFKTKIIQLKKDTENSVKGLRKVIKELKKGYRAQKSLTRMIDIVDKNFNNVKFDLLKKELQKQGINYYGYKSLSEYIKNKKFMSPFIICNYQQRLLMIKYLKQIHSQSKVIIFCNKKLITSQLKESKLYAYVSSYFGKIINFIKKNNVFHPYILDQNEVQIKNKKEKLNKRNKRISALTFCTQNNLKFKDFDPETLTKLQKNFQFLNVSKGTHLSEIFSIQKQAAGIFSLNYSPLDLPFKLKENFAVSLRKLKDLLKINTSEGRFEKVMQQIQNLNANELSNQTMSFFSSENEMGAKINRSLINIQQLSKQLIQSLKEFLFYTNLNFLTFYRDRYVGRIKLHHYLQEELIQKCEIGSSIFNKNYCIFYQSQQQQNHEENIISYRIDLILQSNPVSQNNPLLNSYFRFNSKFVFCPYSQFEIKSIDKKENFTVIQVSYKKNCEFLKCYFAQNLLQTQSKILKFCEDELQKYEKKTSNSFLFDESNKQIFFRNVIHAKALTCYQNNMISQAIKLQKQLISLEQNLENFDSAKQQLLNYQLACFYAKDLNSNECKKTIKDLMESEPNEYIKEKAKELVKLSKNSNKLMNIQNISTGKNIQELKMAEQNKKPVNNDEDDFEYLVGEKQPSASNEQKENIFDPPNFAQIQSLNFQMFEDFADAQKENI